MFDFGLCPCYHCGLRSESNLEVNITILNYAEPVQDNCRKQLRWWHKAGSRWPATIANRGNDGRDYFPYPFLLCYLKSLLETRRHHVALLDGCINKWMPDETASEIKGTKPDFIVFETAEQTESLDRDFLARIADVAPICLIGPNVSETRDTLLEWPGVWACVPGEYLLSVADFFDNPQPGIAARKEVLGMEAMDALPFAYRDRCLFPRYSARFKSTPQGTQGQFVSMWGCQYRCKFCIWIHSYWPASSQKQKRFSISRLEAELDHLLYHFPETTSLYDDSDNHYLDEKSAYSYSTMMRRKKLPWALLTRADTFMRNGDIDRALWRDYRDNGCYAVKIGIEGVQEAMDATNKRLSEEVVRDFIAYMKDLGISVYASFMVGIPGTNAETDRQTIRFAEALSADRPELFEYFVSSCDVTQATPFGAGVRRHNLKDDGQLEFERRIYQGDLAIPASALLPLNLPTASRND